MSVYACGRRVEKTQKAKEVVAGPASASASLLSGRKSA
jgi:hypothetical protein